MEIDQCICGVINNKLGCLFSQEGDFNEGANLNMPFSTRIFSRISNLSSKGFDQGALIEGQAATVESLYLKEFINDSGT